MHKAVWLKNETYNGIMNHYLQFVKVYQPNSYIIFDGYPENKEKSTKTEERQRRQSHFCTTINFALHMPATVSQEKLFLNENNRKRFITKLMAKLQAAGYRTKQAYEDADLLIVQTAIDVTTEEKPDVIIAEDVDVLVTLSQLVNDLKHLLGFIHAFTGCDTTSAFYLQGKQKIIKLLHHDNDFLQKSLIYNSVDANKETIAEVGFKIIADMYSRTLKKLNLNELRYRLFKQKSTSKYFSLAMLLPTEAAAAQHLYRIYYQVQQCFGKSMDPIDWGWILKEGKLKPVYDNEGTSSNINADEYNSSESDDDNSTFEFQYNSDSESNNMSARENLSDSEPRLPKRAPLDSS